MKKSILRFESVSVLSRVEKKNILGGKAIDGGTGSVCKATCNDGSLVTVSACSDAGIGCSTSGGSSSCKCDYPSPLDPPKGD